MIPRLSANLDLTLKSVAVSMLIAVGVEFLTTDRLLFPPVVVANIYFVLSIIAKVHARRIAVIAFGLACVVPIDAVRTFMMGEAGVITLIVVVVASVYLAGVSYQVFRHEASALLDRARRGDSPTEETDTTSD